MRPGKSWTAALASACALLSACGHGITTATQRSTPTAPAEPQIALSVLAHGIYLVDPASGRARVLAEGFTDFEAGFAAWAPDHRSIAYGDDGILMVSPADGGGRVLVKGPSLSMPAWSPDGRSIAYGDGRDLWITPSVSLHATYLHLPLSLAPLDMDWGTTGWIAFEGLALLCHVPFGCSSTSRSDIWTVLPDGSGLHRLTRLDGAERPRWSRDGSRILFVRRRAGHRGELWTVRANGSGTRRVVSREDVLAADWSPDGQRLAMASAGSKPNTVQLWIGNAAGSGLRRIGDPFPGTAATVDW
jgi:Tol biopolymer transport system component